MIGLLVRARARKERALSSLVEGRGVTCPSAEREGVRGGGVARVLSHMTRRGNYVSRPKLQIRKSRAVEILSLFLRVFFFIKVEIDYLIKR